MPIVKTKTTYLLQTNSTTYAVHLGAEGLLRCVYWGEAITTPEDFEHYVPVQVHSREPVQYVREECSSFGCLRLKEASLKLAYADGVRDFRYRVSDSEIDGEHLVLTLEDIHYPLRVRLHYRLYPELDIIEKWREIENHGTEPVLLERFYSAEFGLPGSHWRSINFNGRWGAEFQRYEEPLGTGKKVYESTGGVNGHATNPCFILHKNADETMGEVYFGALAWSGNFKIVAEPTPFEYLSLLIGMSDTDFCWTLGAGGTFCAPPVYCGYTQKGFTGMSHTMSRFARTQVMPKARSSEILPILYNSWDVTEFDVNSENQIALAKRAAAVGIELFVIDDGWFSGRKTEFAGLGDWFVDTDKFPQGLGPVIDTVKGLGMRFGLWVEPEMVNPGSRLYKDHPDWIYRYETREPLMTRHQYILDMTNPAVSDYLYACLDKLLSENEVDYIKWDMNRYTAEAASPALDKDRFREIWVRHTANVYDLVARLRARHPRVEFECCASGGGRVDYGAMRYFDEYWTSDNTDALDRLVLQENYSLMYPVKHMRAWYIDDPGLNGRKIPFRFKMLGAMCGVLGICSNLVKADEQTLSLLTEYIALYKTVRKTVQLGTLYRLKSLQRDDFHAVQYSDEEQTVLFAFLDHIHYTKQFYHVCLRGLEDTARYTFTLGEQEYTHTGGFLNRVGLQLPLTGDYDSLLVVLKKRGCNTPCLNYWKC